MSKPLNEIILGWIGENADTGVSFEYGYYNEALADLRARVPDLIKSIAERIKSEDVTCPEAHGFEGRNTFPDCGKCIVCELSKLISE